MSCSVKLGLMHFGVQKRGPLVIGEEAGSAGCTEVWGMSEKKEELCRGRDENTSSASKSIYL